MLNWFYFKRIETEYAFKRMRLLCWCLKASWKYYGYCGDGWHGNYTMRLTGLNFIRMVLDLYFEVQGRCADDRPFGFPVALHVLNMNIKYKDGWGKPAAKEFNVLMDRWKIQK